MPEFHNKTMWKAVKEYTMGRSQYNRNPSVEEIRIEDPYTATVKNLKSQDLKDLLSTKHKKMKEKSKVVKTIDNDKLSKFMSNTTGHLPKLN